MTFGLLQVFEYLPEKAQDLHVTNCLFSRFAKTFGLQCMFKFSCNISFLHHIDNEFRVDKTVAKLRPSKLDQLAEMNCLKWAYHKS